MRKGPEVLETNPHAMIHITHLGLANGRMHNYLKASSRLSEEQKNSPNFPSLSEAMRFINYMLIDIHSKDNPALCAYIVTNSNKVVFMWFNRANKNVSVSEVPYNDSADVIRRASGYDAEFVLAVPSPNVKGAYEIVYQDPEYQKDYDARVAAWYEEHPQGAQE